MQLKQGGDIVQGEAGRLRGTDKPQPLPRCLLVDPVIARARVLGKQKTDALVIAYRRGGYADCPGELADGVGLAHTPKYSNFTGWSS